MFWCSLRLVQLYRQGGPRGRLGGWGDSPAHLNTHPNYFYAVFNLLV